MANSGRVSLGLNIKPDPWLKANERYIVGSKIREGGQPCRLWRFRWRSRRDRRARPCLGDVLDKKGPTSIPDPEGRGRDWRQVMNTDTTNSAFLSDWSRSNPTLGCIGERYPVGTTIEGRIKNITDFGIFIGIDEGFTPGSYLGHLLDQADQDPSELYKKGQTVQAVVLNIDKENERFLTGHQTAHDGIHGWVPSKYSPEPGLTGTVTNVNGFRCLCGTGGAIEGLSMFQSSAKDKSGNPLSRFNVDDVIQAKVINVSRARKKIGLSIKRLKNRREGNLQKLSRRRTVHFESRGDPWRKRCTDWKLRHDRRRQIRQGRDEHKRTEGNNRRDVKPEAVKLKGSLNVRERASIIAVIVVLAAVGLFLACHDPLFHRGRPSGRFLSKRRSASFL